MKNAWVPIAKNDPVNSSSPPLIRITGAPLITKRGLPITIDAGWIPGISFALVNVVAVEGNVSASPFCGARAAQPVQLPASLHFVLVPPCQTQLAANACGPVRTSRSATPRPVSDAAFGFTSPLRQRGEKYFGPSDSGG